MLNQQPIQPRAELQCNQRSDMSFKANLFNATDVNDSTPIAEVTIPQGDSPEDGPSLVSWKGRLFAFVTGSDFAYGPLPTPAYREVVPLVIDS